MVVILVGLYAKEGKVAAFLVERGETLTFESDLGLLGRDLVSGMLELGLMLCFFEQGGRRSGSCRAERCKAVYPTDVVQFL